MLRRIRCWWAGHPLCDDYEVVQWIRGPDGLGVIVRRWCHCGHRYRLGSGVEHTHEHQTHVGSVVNGLGRR